MTEFEKKNDVISASSSDNETEPEGKQVDTAPLQNNVIPIRKVTTISAEKQKEQLSPNGRNNMIFMTVRKSERKSRMKKSDTFVKNNSDGRSSNSEDAGIQPEGKTGSRRNVEVARELGQDRQADSGTLRGSQSDKSEQEKGLE